MNGKQVPLHYKLHNGDRVEIVTANSGGPSRDWLNENLGYIVTHRARQKVRQYFRKQNRADAVVVGRELLEKAAKKFGVEDEGFALLTKLGNFGTSEEMFAAIGYGDVSAQTVVTRLLDKQKEEEIKFSRAPAKSPAGGMSVKGVGGLLTNLARCCNPIPGDPIIGYVTRGRGVTVHRQDCRNLMPHRGAAERLIEVAWGSTVDEANRAGADPYRGDRPPRSDARCRRCGGERRRKHDLGQREDQPERPHGAGHGHAADRPHVTAKQDHRQDRAAAQRARSLPPDGPLAIRCDGRKRTAGGDSPSADCCPIRYSRRTRYFGSLAGV